MLLCIYVRLNSIRFVTPMFTNDIVFADKCQNYTHQCSDEAMNATHYRSFMSLWCWLKQTMSAWVNTINERNEQLLTLHLYFKRTHTHTQDEWSSVAVLNWKSYEKCNAFNKCRYINVVFHAVKGEVVVSSTARSFCYRWQKDSECSAAKC